MKFQSLLLACALNCGNVLVQAQNSAATTATTAENKTLNTPAERERIKAVCLAESQAFLDLDYYAWATHHLHTENEHLTWNNPDGSFGDQCGWKAISDMMNGFCKGGTKNTGKLSHLNHAFYFYGNMAYVNFDGGVAQADGKTVKLKEHRIMIYDASSSA